jgi:hypothetical protein
MRASIMPDDRPCCHKNVANRGFRNIEMTPPFLDTFRLLLSRQTVGSIRGGRSVGSASNAGASASCRRQNAASDANVSASILSRSHPA